MIRFMTCEILLNEDCPEMLRYITLWHESLHAFETQMGVEFGEKTVEGLAFHIVNFLIENGLPASK